MSTKQPVSYHPTFSERAEWSPGRRKVRNRLEAMSVRFDFRDATVLDLGCSGGFFAFEIARYARKVVAIDADEHQILLNQELAKQRRITNIEFRVGVISPALISELGTFDAALFLSVLHHIIAASDAYDWNQRPNDGMSLALGILRELSRKTKSLFFEIGQTNEDHSWAKSLPPMMPTPDRWIVEHLLVPGGFTSVETIDPPDLKGLIGRARRIVHTHVEPRFKSAHAINRVLTRLIAYDTRDVRYMFFAKGAPSAINGR